MERLSKENHVPVLYCFSEEGGLEGGEVLLVEGVRHIPSHSTIDHQT